MCIIQSIPSMIIWPNKLQKEKINKPQEAADRVIDTIAKRELLKFSVALVSNCAVIGFTAGVLGGAHITISMFTLALVAVFVDITVKASWNLYFGSTSEYKNFWHVIHHALSDNAVHLSNLSLMNVIGLSYPNLLFHESGHALAAQALFKNPKTKMMIFPFRDGQTQYVVSNGLTSLGSLLGKTNAMALACAGGLLFSFVLALGEFLLSDHFKDAYPALSEFLDLHAKTQLLGEIVSCLHAVISIKPNVPLNLGNDYAGILHWGGIHPWMILVLLIGMPVIKKISQEPEARRCITRNGNS